MALKLLLALIILLATKVVIAGITFDKAIEIIKFRSIILNKDKAQLDAASIQNYASKLNFLPDLSSFGSIAKYERGDAKIKTYGASLNFNVWKNFADLNYLKESNAFSSLSDNQFRRDELLLEQEAVTSLVNRVYQEQILEVQQKLYDLRMEALNVSKKRYKRGLAPEEEVTMADIDLANTQATLNDKKILLENAQASLSELLGEQNVENLWPWKRSFLKGNFNKFIQHTFSLENHPAYKTSFFAQVQAKAKRDQIFADIGPTLDLNLNRQLTDSPTSRSWETVGTLTLTIPLFSGWRDLSRFENQHSSFVSAQQNMTGKKRELLAQFIAIKKNFRLSFNTALERENTLNKSESVYKVNFKRYRAGRLPYLDLIRDQERYFNSLNLAQSGWRDLHLNTSRFCYFISKTVKSCLASL